MRSGCLLSLLFLWFFSASKAQPIGSWQEHLSYHNSIAVGTDGVNILSASRSALFQFDPNKEEYLRNSTIHGLSGASIRTINSNPSATIIAYENSQLDILQNNHPKKVNTIRLSNILANKQINSIWRQADQCLLATGFGLAVLNVEKGEIGDVYLIGNDGRYASVNQLAADGQYFYAAGAEGLKRAPRSGSNLADYRHWETLGESAGLPAGAIQAVFFWKNALFVRQGSRLFKQTGTLFSLFYEDNRNWLSIDTGVHELLISQTAAAQSAGILKLNEQAQLLGRLQHPALRQPKQVLFSNNQYWVADEQSGLLRIDGDIWEAMIPNSPAGLGTGGLLTRPNYWWATGDSVASRFSNGNWENFLPGSVNWPANFRQVGPVSPGAGQDIWFGSALDGICQWNESGFTIHKEPLLSAPAGASGTYKVGGLYLDQEQNLWITNDGATKGLVVYRNNANSLSFEIPFFYPGFRLGQIVADDLQQKWMIAPGFGVFCYNQGNSLEQTGDDQWRFFQQGAGNGNLPSSQVLCLAKDHFGFIWMGTADGIGILQCPEQVFSTQGCEVQLPVVQTDNFAGYLFKGERVQAIAVDGANRKWVGTQNGLWLISASGDKTLLRFTSANSPLPDNDVKQLSIDPRTGSVLIATANGMVSYQSTATEGGTSNSNLIVYPNPVPPGYTGAIAVRGLVHNATVKITELNGRLVYQGRALGGQAIWNGLDLNGKRVATGVYLVWVSDDSRKEQAVTKIVFIQQ